MTSDIAIPKRNGLTVLWDTIVAPAAAFAELKLRPHWGWAVLLTCVIGTIGGYLQVPANEHVAAYVVAHDPQFATMSAEQIESAKKMSGAIQHWAWLGYAVTVLIGFGFAALVYLVANAIGGGNGNFARLFALVANIGFLNFGIGYLMHGIVVALKGPESFQTTNDLLGAIPTLGWLVPAGSVKAHAFFSMFTVFQIWSLVLAGLGLQAVANIRPVIAWTAPSLLLLGAAALSAAFVH
jgi:hypothetical protein